MRRRMLVNVFFQPEAKRRIGDVVREVEAVTSAEVVVSVAPSSARYREAPLVVGALAALGMLLLVLFHPAEVRLVAIPVDVVLAFGAAAILTDKIDPLRRIVCGRRRMREETRRAARTLFVDRHLTRTRRRSAVFVYLSTFEKRVEVVADLGVEAAVPAPDWQVAVDRLGLAIADRFDLDAFVGALRSLGPLLSVALPRDEDDENELPDAPDT